MIVLAMRKEVDLYNPLARSLIIAARSSKKAGMYATAIKLMKALPKNKAFIKF